MYEYVGNIRFRTELRHYMGDRGPSIHVDARMRDGRWAQIMRYDCFERQPHRHYFFADGREEKVELRVMSVEEAVDMAAKDLGSLIQLIQRLGYEKVVADLPSQEQIDANEFRSKLLSLYSSEAEPAKAGRT